ncbi:MAG: S8 family peptidase [Roseburia sp.]|nr:S8 family peptidase [Roseburia sp.]MCM1241950.1 S8 family peptidase [Roseburia sp.]
MYRVRNQLGCSERIQLSCKGGPVTVAVLDTGFYEHPDLAGRVLAFHDFVNHRSRLYDDSGHGTHVAGCIGGNGLMSNGRYRGIAPGCLFCIGKVLDQNGEGSIESMYHGLLWVMQNRLHHHIRVLNISVGIGNPNEKSKVEAVVGLLEAVWKSGIVVVCAAGNDGPKDGTISPLGNSRKVITVGCHEDGYFGNRSNLCENYSGRGDNSILYRKPDVVAPGTDIVSCSNRGSGYVKKSGTSMAAPVVSGAAALLLQKYPYLNNEQVKRKIVYSARDLGDSWNKQGWGMLDIERLFLE